MPLIGSLADQTWSKERISELEDMSIKTSKWKIKQKTE